MKKLNLLLASTAILSAGFAMNANADTATATLQAGVELVPSTLTITSTPLLFGSLLPEAGATYVMNPTQAPSGTAKQLGWLVGPGTVVIEGPTEFMQTQTAVGNDEGFVLVFDDATITLKDNIGQGNNVCGVVDNLTQAVPSTAATNGSWTIKYGGRLTLDSGIEDISTNGAICGGATTVTVMQRDAARVTAGATY